MAGKLAEALRKNRDRATSQFLPFFKFPSGKSTIRILPASKEDNSDDWFLPVGFHYNMDEKKPVVCRYETNWGEEACPACEVVRELRIDGMNDEAQKISVRRAFIVRAIVRGEEKKGVQQVRLPSTLFTPIGEIVEDEETFGDVLHPGPKGRDIRVTKTGQNLNTSYQAQAIPDTGPALQSKQDVLEILKELKAISTLIQIPDYDEVKDIVEKKLGFSASDMGASADDEDDDEAEQVAATAEVKDEDSDEDSWVVGDDDEEADVPFDQAAEERTAETSPAEDGDSDSWMEDDDDDGEPIVDVSELARKDQGLDEKSEAAPALKEGLEKDLGKKHITRKRGKSRRPKPESTQV